MLRTFTQREWNGQFFSSSIYTQKSMWLLATPLPVAKGLSICLARFACIACLDIYIVSLWSQLPTAAHDKRNRSSSHHRHLGLLLIIPTSNATSERSFSTLRRLKTWLRMSMTRNLLNNCALLWPRSLWTHATLKMVKMK